MGGRKDRLIDSWWRSLAIAETAGSENTGFEADALSKV